jgi:hypothetical protein
LTCLGRHAWESGSGNTVKTRMGIGWKASNSGKPREHQVFTPCAHGKVSKDAEIILAPFVQFTPCVNGEVCWSRQACCGGRIVHSLCAWRSPSSHRIRGLRTSVHSLCAWKSRRLPPLFCRQTAHSLCAWRSLATGQGDHTKQFNPHLYGEVGEVYD